MPTEYQELGTGETKDKKKRLSAAYIGWGKGERGRRGGKRDNMCVCMYRKNIQNKHKIILGKEVMGISGNEERLHLGTQPGRHSPSRSMRNLSRV